MLTAVLTGVPNQNQLDQREATGQLAINRAMLCVPTALADAASFLLGRVITGAQLEDAVYGPTYQGGEDARNYATYCRNALGLAITAVYVTNQQALVAGVQRAVQAGHPVVVTIPSEWGLPPPADPVHPDGWTHAVCVKGVGPDEMLASNPWQGVDLRNSVAWWTPRLLYGCYFVVSRLDGRPAGVGGETSMGLNLSGLGAGFLALAKAMGVSQNSGGEHRITPHEVYAAGRDGAGGVVFYYNDQTGECTATKPDTVANLLYGQVVNLTAKLEAVTRERDALKAAQATPAQPQPHNPVDPLPTPSLSADQLAKVKALLAARLTEASALDAFLASIHAPAQ